MMDRTDCNECGNDLPAFALSEDGVCVSCILRETQIVDAVTWGDVRAHRDHLIGRTDWTRLDDVPLTVRDAWTVVRQQLRDVTEHETADDAWDALIAIEANHFS